MLNLFTTPENKEFVFVIPENAKTDINGFYIIDEDFKKLNKHIDFNYLSHDLECRGLNSKESFFDRKDYLDGKISHKDYYLQATNIDNLKSALISYFGYDKLVNSNDEYMNDIPLRQWDFFNSKPYLKKTYKYAEAASYVDRDRHWANKDLLWSMSQNVSLAKQVAFLIRDEHKAKAVQNASL